MNKLADALEGGSQGWQGARYVRIEGATHVRDRHAALAAFRKDPAIRVALLSVTAAGKVARLPHVLAAVSMGLQPCRLLLRQLLAGIQSGSAILHCSRHVGEPRLSKMWAEWMAGGGGHLGGIAAVASMRRVQQYVRLFCMYAGRQL